MSIAALQEYTFVSRYARYQPHLGRRESWHEAVDRVEQMHRQRYPQIADEIEQAFELVHAKRVLGSQRALQFGGIGVLPGHAYLYNCTASYCDRLRFFQEALWLAACGCGVGCSVQLHHVARLPRFSTPTMGLKPRRTFVVPDSIEGCADALGVLLSSFFESPVFPEFACCRVEFDYRRLRPAGAISASGSGKANGPEPLVRALEAIRSLLAKCIEQGQDRLRPIDAYDIVMHASSASMAGGSRSPATICVFSPDDELMLRAKTGNWFYENPQRAVSNNSCLLLRKTTSREAFHRILTMVREFGEPGFIWADSTEYLVNPCCEVGFWPVDEVTGESGWAFCNLTEINGRKVRSGEEFAAAADAAAVIGTLQAGYTDFPYLGPVTERLVRREALLGVSITGIMDNPQILLDAELQREMAERTKSANAAIAHRIGIQPAARTTCIKPAGSSSCLLGTASGIHPHHASRYLRRVQASDIEAPFQFFRHVNPQAVERSVWSTGQDRSAITFCVEASPGAKTKQDLSAIEFLRIVRSTQQNWVLPGTRRERCTQPWLTHNVSNTVVVGADAWERVGDFIFDNREFFTGVSLLPASGDKDYPQAPMAKVLLPDEIAVEYGPAALWAARLLARLRTAFDGDLWLACDTLLGRGPKSRSATAAAMRSEKAWLDKARRVADGAFCGDAHRLSHCLKDWCHYQRWNELQSGIREVNYLDMIEDEDQTQFVREMACAGGACLV
jgi:ribonucleoside-triphosphate reductase (thioredoxin)